MNRKSTPAGTEGTAATTIRHLSAAGAPQVVRQTGSGREVRPVRVLVADDHPVVRSGMKSCLSGQAQIQVVGEASDGEEALRKAKALSPDIVLMDMEMPRMNGLTAAELLRKENPGIKVLMLSMHTETEFVLRTLQSGVRGYLLKDSRPEELVKAIETVQSGETSLAPEIARAALTEFVRGPGAGPHAGQLSGREREVLVAIAEGLSNKEIACRLGVGVRTAETHRERLMRKLNIHSVAGLTRFAVQKGLLPMSS